ncbi:MAG: phage integrase N-terminal SAM-like domain-containing protein [Pirellulales bacterium]|nr:phage integrase N-terminal SAM-like domain-containing protein [Pirellulales bacterium]
MREDCASKEDKQALSWDDAISLVTRHMKARNLRPGSIGQYLGTIRVLRRAFPKTHGPDDITPRMAETYKLMRAEDGYEPRTIRNDINNLSIVYGLWWRNVCKILDANPFAEVVPPKEDKVPPRIVTPEEKQRFFSWLENRWPGWRLPVLLLEVKAAIGCRIGELAGATTDGLQEGRLIFTSKTTKGRKQRACLLPPALFAELQQIAGPVYVFERFARELFVARKKMYPFLPFTPARLVKWLQGEADRYFRTTKAKRFKLHSLRATAMSQARMAGIPEGDAAVAFGCNPETMRKHYLNLDEVAIADQVFARMGAYRGRYVGNALGLTPKKRRNLLTGKEVAKLPDKDSNLGQSG